MAKIDGLEIVMTKQMQKMIDKELKKRFEELKPELATRYEELLNMLWADIEAKDKRVAELVQTLSHIVYRGGQIIVNLNERVREDEWNRLTRGIVVDEERER